MPYGCSRNLSINVLHLADDSCPIFHRVFDKGAGRL